MIEKAYDAKLAEIAANSTACSAADWVTIEADLRRFSAGYFAPRRAVVTDERFGSLQWWKDQEDVGY